jgi:hypothetical protein
MIEPSDGRRQARSSAHPAASLEITSWVSISVDQQIEAARLRLHQCGIATRPQA